MANEELKIDANSKSTTGFVTDDSNQFIRNARIDDATKGLKVMVVGGLDIAYSGADIVVNTVGTGDFTDIQSALDAVPSGGATIWVADGTYTVTTGLVVKQTGTRLILSGGAIVQCNGNTVPILMSATSGLSRIEIWGGKWLQTSVSAVGTGFDMSNLSDCIIHPTRIEMFNIGLNIDDTTNSTFYNRYKEIQIFNCNTCMQIGVTSTSTQPNNNYFEAIRCRPLAGGAGFGVRIADARGLTFISCDFEPGTGTGITGISLEQNATSLGFARECVFINCWVENNATNVLIASGCNRNSFFGSTITGPLTTNISDAGTNTVFVNCNSNATLLTQLGSQITSQAFTVNFACANTPAPADANTYYFGFPYDVSFANNSPSIRQKIIPYATTLRAAGITITASAGATSETTTISAVINNTTAVVLSSAITMQSTAQYFPVTGLAQAISAGDAIEIRLLTPTWVTNPTNVRISVDLYFS